LLDDPRGLQVTVAALVGDLEQDGPSAAARLALGDPAELAQVADGECGALRRDADDAG
jgi:hypothetical protein